MNGFEKWSVWVTSILAGITGVGYFWTKYLAQSDDPFSVVNHPLEPWLLKAHIVLSPFLLFAVGSIFVRHVWKHVRLGVVLGRRSGLTGALVFLPMVLSGYLIQSVTNPGRLATLAVSHIGLGGIYLVGLCVHQVVVHRRQTTRKSRGPRATPPLPSGYSGEDRI